MASFIFPSFYLDCYKGNIDIDTDSYKFMLLGTGYTQSYAHDRRDDLSSEASGAGYSAGGAAVTVAGSSINAANKQAHLVFNGVTWPNSSITARYAVLYKARGGASSADELIAVVDFGSAVTTTNTTFSVSSVTITVTVP